MEMVSGSEHIRSEKFWYLFGLSASELVLPSTFDSSLGHFPCVCDPDSAFSSPKAENKKTKIKANVDVENS